MTASNGSADDLIFLPIGGTGQIGMNLSLYGLDGQWIAVDFGISFADERTPGVDLILPDITFLEENKDKLLGIVLTHAHEDHFGAIPYLWKRLGCPVYATPFTAEFLRLKLKETDFADQVPIHEIPLGGRFELGPFDLEYVTVTHSIPEPNALAIRTRHGLVLHSGDWKLDPDPLIGDITDAKRLRALGDEGVMAYIGDSTNAMEHGRTGSESAARAGMAEVISRCEGRVAVTCFSTNIARINSIAHAAHANGRHCALVGRSLWRAHAAAEATGYVDVPEPFVTEYDAGYLPRDKVVLIVAGSQGEARSSLTRIAHGDHNDVVMEPGDTVIYSARDIPGNEKAIARVQNAFAASGIEVVTPHEAPVHVSGHPARDELAEMYQWIRPALAIPVHGELRHMLAHAELAKHCQVPKTLIPHEGAIIRLAPGPAEVVDHLSLRKLGFDGQRIVELEGEAVRGRARLSFNGAAMVTVVVDDNGVLQADPHVTLVGLEEEDRRDEVEADLEDLVDETVERLSKKARRDDDQLGEAVRIAIRRAVRHLSGKKPVTQVHVVRV
jgi:ribonuclease J